jgi:SpoVK/Ycf46/Vps4 family AAA+-type ATPase
MSVLRSVVSVRPLTSLMVSPAVQQALRVFVNENRMGMTANPKGTLFLSGGSAAAAAESVAHELERGLMRVDMSAIVSKYIGETEKNLDRAFEAAKQSGAVLFFDEGNALFGKRSEVKDTHDRFANVEIDYLLQRMESFGGIVIVATNAPVPIASCRFCRFVELGAAGK